MSTLAFRAVGIWQGLEGLAAISHGRRRSGKMRPIAERYTAPGVSNLFTVSPDDKSQLILAVARTRDRESFRALFLHFAPRVKSYLIKRGTPAGLADELAQETLLTVWRKAESFDPMRASASTWIFTIARNLRIDMMRRAASRDVPVDYAEDALTAPSPGDEYLSNERNQKLGEALKDLPGDQADVVRLSFFEEKPHPEIAAQLGIPLGTVKSRLRLAMNRLRTVLEDIQ
jgi:RNA polymerase sigma-70 factor (ECF subfamily)